MHVNGGAEGKAASLSDCIVCLQIVALLLPFFNDIVALLGAIGFAPLTIFFPVRHPATLCQAFNNAFSNAGKHAFTSLLAQDVFVPLPDKSRLPCMTAVRMLASRGLLMHEAATSLLLACMPDPSKKNWTMHALRAITMECPGLAHALPCPPPRPRIVHYNGIVGRP